MPIWISSIAQYGYYITRNHKQLVSEYRQRAIKWCSIHRFEKSIGYIDHDILLKKLAHYGVDQISLTWFRSYLSDRTQRCYVNAHLSKSRSVKYGVPQGSITGPLLFLVCINDLPDCLNNGSPRMYADDTNVSFQTANLNELEEMMTSDVSRLNTWLKANRLSLSIAKTEYMVIGTRQRLAAQDVQWCSKV